jgi:hypothetical protein
LSSASEGDLRKVSPVFGHPILLPAAFEAAKKSKYRPYLLEGRPVEIEGEVECDIP